MQNRPFCRLPLPWVCRVVALLAIAVALWRAASTIDRFNNVVDEPYHLGSAACLYRDGKHTAGVQHPPLARLVAGVPLWLHNQVPQEAASRTVIGPGETYDVGTRVLFADGQDYWATLRRSRLAMLVFLPVALVYLYLMARWAADEVCAALAVAFCSLDPTVLAHAPLVTTDMPACALFLASIYHGARWASGQRISQALAAGGAAGLAIGTKFSLIIVAPALVLMVLLQPVGVLFSTERGRWSLYLRRLPPLRQMAIVLVMSFLSLWMLYLFDIGPIADQRIFVGKSEWEALPGWFKTMPLPMPSFILGLMELYGHNRFGHLAYLNGDIGLHGWWWYFPEVIALKMPSAALLALVLAVIAAACRRSKAINASLFLLLLPAGLFFLAALSARINIGIRHILPVLPVIYLFIAIQLKHARWRIVAAVLLAATAAQTIPAHPNYLGYFNEIAGGSQGAERYVLDSNLDWGQDIAQLAEWLNAPEQAGRPYALRLFAYPEEDLVKVLGLDPDALHRPPTGLVAVSKNVRHGLVGATIIDRGARIELPDYSWLARYPVVKHIGTSIDVYEVDSQVEPEPGERESIRPDQVQGSRNSGEWSTGPA